ncbi:MAG: hypothetical protein K9L59_02250 [Desulfobacterales bacterium]|nr:hypothetical protein [Desulfobacterales bacterium]
MSNLRKPDSKEGHPVSSSRYDRLRDAVSGQWAGMEQIRLIYWSEEDGGRWVIWLNPDPIDEAGVSIDS